MEKYFPQQNIVYSTEWKTYAQMEGQSHSQHEHRCIDGRLKGCGKCVGYCQYGGHPGFLTEKLKEKHQCTEKECGYFIKNPRKLAN